MEKTLIYWFWKHNTNQDKVFGETNCKTYEHAPRNVPFERITAFSWTYVAPQDRPENNRIFANFAVEELKSGEYMVSFTIPGHFGNDGKYVNDDTVRFADRILADAFLKNYKHIKGLIKQAVEDNDKDKVYLLENTLKHMEKLLMPSQSNGADYYTLSRILKTEETEKPSEENGLLKEDHYGFLRWNSKEFPLKVGDKVIIGLFQTETKRLELPFFHVSKIQPDHWFSHVVKGKVLSIKQDDVQFLIEYHNGNEVAPIPRDLVEKTMDKGIWKDN